MAVHSPDLRDLCSLMLERGLIDEEQVRYVLAKENAQRQRLLKGQEAHSRQGRHRIEIANPELLASFNLPIPGKKNATLTEDRIAQVLAEAAKLPHEKVDPLKLDMKLVTSIFSRPFARRHSVLALGLDNGTLSVAVADPFDVELLENLRRITSYQIAPVVSAKSDIQRIITEMYGFRTSPSQGGR